MALQADGSGWRAAAGPAWAEVDLDAVAENTRRILALLASPCRLLAVVKANAYGHGAVEVATTALQAGASGCGVSTVAEGLALRAAGVPGPILAFTPPRPIDVPAALQADLTVTVTSLETARLVADEARRIGRTATAHVKLDTGMGRYGFEPAQILAAVSALGELGDAVRWEGIYTHFARGADATATRAQLARFTAAVDAAAAAGLTFPVRHAAASSATLTVPEAHLDMVRVGTLLLGDRPAGTTPPPGLRRAFALYAEPTQVRVLSAGATVGYGSEWHARRPTRVAVLPVGYADGLDMVPGGPYRRPAVLIRALGRAILSALGLSRRLGAAAGEITIAGRRAPVLGRVGMQQVTVDCTNIPETAMGEPALVHARATSVGGHIARVFLRDGVAVRASTLAGNRDGLLASDPSVR